MDPLVSCILVTRDRPGFVRQALRCYAAQRYSRRELIVVDDGVRPVERLCRTLPDVTYIRLTDSTPTGSKLNLGIEAARGNILQKIDDDDYYGPEFLSLAVNRLRATRKRNVLVAWCCFVVLIAGQRRLHFSGHGWHPGGTLCFRRSLWKRHPFRDIYASSDSWFIRDNRPAIMRVCAAEQYIVVRHGRNTWKRIKGASSVEDYFKRRPFRKRIRTLVGDANVAFYRSLMDSRALGP
jgi:glycosyltransferase involved in cell wall biosynthesis